ncbi:MAG: ATP-binding cassette domain-containing protein, partial [Acidimicrobiia bacterium]|nr:ATP-binding cassette domain-containing protein [Acidimicrobiia bacterium]
MSTLRTAHLEGSPFVPPVGPSAHPRPKSTIGRDQQASWLRRALPIVLAHKWLLASSLVASFVGLLIQVQIPAVLRSAIDEALVARSRPVGYFVAAILVLGAAKWVVTYVGRLNLFRTAYRIESDLRNIVYEHLAQLSFSFYDRVQSGQVISRANSDIRSVQMYLAFAPSILVQCSVAVVAFWKMLTIDVPLAFVAMATMPLVYWAGARMRNQSFPISWLNQARQAEVAGLVAESTDGVRVVRSFAAEERQLRKLDEAARRVRWALLTDAGIRARWAPLIENLSRVGSALVLVYGGWLVIEGRATIGTIVAFNAYVLMLQPPFRLLGLLLMMGRRAAASAGRIYEILDERPDVVDRPGAVDLVECRGELALSGVDFDYPNGTPVLRGLDLHLEPGDTLALVGRTGSGKSTIARLLCRFYDVTGGSIALDGHDVRDLTLVSLRHHVGMVLDEPFLFSDSIRDNITFGRPGASDEEVVAAAKAANAHEFISRLPAGYDTVVGERGYTLSGGQRQRVSIARTLLTNPPVLVLDDATSAIDVQVEHEIHEALSRLMQGRTTIIIAHRLSTISLAARVAVLEEGRILAEGTHAELLAGEP